MPGAAAGADHLRRGRAAESGPRCGGLPIHRHCACERVAGLRHPRVKRHSVAMAVPLRPLEHDAREQHPAGDVVVQRTAVQGAAQNCRSR